MIPRVEMGLDCPKPEFALPGRWHDAVRKGLPTDKTSSKLPHLWVSETQRAHEKCGLWYDWYVVSLMNNINNTRRLYPILCAYTNILTIDDAQHATWMTDTLSRLIVSSGFPIPIILEGPTHSVDLANSHWYNLIRVEDGVMFQILHPTIEEIRNTILHPQTPQKTIRY